VPRPSRGLMEAALWNRSSLRGIARREGPEIPDCSMPAAVPEESAVQTGEGVTSGRRLFQCGEFPPCGLMVALVDPVGRFRGTSGLARAGVQTAHRLRGADWWLSSVRKGLGWDDACD
jgi:hypothetical protein